MLKQKLVMCHIADAVVLRRDLRSPKRCSDFWTPEGSLCLPEQLNVLESLGLSQCHLHMLQKGCKDQCALTPRLPKCYANLHSEHGGLLVGLLCKSQEDAMQTQGVMLWSVNQQTTFAHSLHHFLFRLRLVSHSDFYPHPNP
eukprot:2709448-Amphidinium_carterae.1